MSAYHAAVNAAIAYARGADEGWNARFRRGLEINGLALVAKMPPTDARYPGGFAFMAPSPFGSADAWPNESYLAIKDGEATSTQPGRCRDCKFWGKESHPVYNRTPWDGLRNCDAIEVSWEPDANDRLAVVEDGSMYHAALLSRADFGCVLFVAKEPQP